MKKRYSLHEYLKDETQPPKNLPNDTTEYTRKVVKEVLECKYYNFPSHQKPKK